DHNDNPSSGTYSHKQPAYHMCIYCEEKYHIRELSSSWSLAVHNHGLAAEQVTNIFHMFKFLKIHHYLLGAVADMA
ncbi:hypothetical protein HAX54_044385, partial [Datura stramonium]|nr:hypothetical protein [Datura stramonium]